jgi:hypothetical protein
MPSTPPSPHTLSLAPEVRFSLIGRHEPAGNNRTSAASKAPPSGDVYVTFENHLTSFFITLGEPLAHGDTAEAAEPFG